MEDSRQRHTRNKVKKKEGADSQIDVVFCDLFSFPFTFSLSYVTTIYVLLLKTFAHVRVSLSEKRDIIHSPPPFTFYLLYFLFLHVGPACLLSLLLLPPPSSPLPCYTHYRLLAPSSLIWAIAFKNARRCAFFHPFRSSSSRWDNICKESKPSCRSSVS